MSGPAPSPDWLNRRRVAAARALRRAVSATELSQTRAGFGWTVRPAPGSILASTRNAHWDPEPDYFHHWIRDAAIALAAVPEAIAAEPGARGFWQEAVADHIRFSLAISDPARRGPDRNPLRASARADHLNFLRPDAELAALTGEAWLAEPRVAADGGPDLERWARPQDDGPGLRASTLMRLIAAMPEFDTPEAEALIARDIAHIARVAGRPCIGPWEEAPARRTTFTLIVQWDALDRAARRDGALPGRRAAAERLAGLMALAADRESGGWRESIEAPAGHLDSATVLAILHAGRSDGQFALDAPRSLATAAALEAIFAGLYPINRGRAVPAMGRWAGDVFFGGNPWVPVTLGFAELHYRIAALRGDARAFDKAEGWMALIEEATPTGEDLPEQIHRETGAPESCRALTWSAAAFLGAAAARAAACQAMGSSR